MLPRKLGIREIREYKAVIRALTDPRHICSGEDAQLIRAHVGRMIRDLDYTEKCESSENKSVDSGKSFENYFEEALKNAESCN